MTKPAPDPITPNFNAQNGLCLLSTLEVGIEKSAPEKARNDFFADIILNNSKNIVVSANTAGGALPACRNVAHVAPVSFSPKK